MAVICNICGLPEDLCACGELAKDSTKIIIRLETRRFKKKGTMIEGLDPKLNNLENVAKELKNKYACGGTAKEGYIFLQGDHRDTIKDTLIDLGFPDQPLPGPLWSLDHQKDEQMSYFELRKTDVQPWKNHQRYPLPIPH